MHGSAASAGVALQALVTRAMLQRATVSASGGPGLIVGGWAWVGMLIRELSFRPARSPISRPKIVAGS
eukprot:9402132-Alexandrium_andersonii.AAC.1